MALNTDEPEFGFDLPGVLGQVTLMIPNLVFLIWKTRNDNTYIVELFGD